MGEIGEIKNIIKQYFKNIKRKKKIKLQLLKEKQKKDKKNRLIKLKLAIIIIFQMFIYLFTLVVPVNLKKDKLTSKSEKEKVKVFIKESNEVLTKIDAKIKENEKNKDKLITIKEEIKDYKKKEMDLKKEIDIKKYKNDPEIKKIDKNNFISANVFLKKEEQCDIKIEKINNTLKEKRREEDKRMMMQEENKNLSEQANFIKTKLESEKNYINWLEQDLNKSGINNTKKKKNVLNKVLKNTFLINFGFCAALKSRGDIFNFLAGMILTNHGIRGMRNIFHNKKNEYNYDELIEQINLLEEENDILYTTIDFCNDSLEEINNLKNDYLLKYGISNEYESTIFLNQLQELEEDLKMQRKMLVIKQNKINNIHEKSKIKIKREI